MRKLRIAVWYNLNNGGSKRAFYDQVRGLVERGHHVEAWCPPTAEMTYLPIAGIVKEHVVPLASVPARGKGPLEKRRHFALESTAQARVLEDHCRQCAQEMRAGSFDLLLAHPCKFYSTTSIGAFVGLPSILYLQEPNRYLYEAIPELVWTAPPARVGGSFLSRWNNVITEACVTHGRRVQVRYEQAWAKAFDQVLVNSHFSRESVLRAFNIDARVCYLGIDADEFRIADEPKEAFVIGLGNLKFNKRPVLAIEAVGAIPAAQRPRLVWVSNANSDKEIQMAEETARRCGVQFELKTLVSEAELHTLLSRAAVLLYTSKLEPFGYAPLEANACGTGVVGIAEGGIRETLAHPDSGVLVSGSDPEPFARELVKFTSDLSFATAFGRRARAHVEAVWSLPPSIDRLEAELERVLSRRAQQAV